MDAVPWWVVDAADAPGAAALDEEAFAAFVELEEGIVDDGSDDDDE